MVIDIWRRWRQRRITVAEWADEYKLLVISLHLKPKTLTNRFNCLGYVVEHLGCHRLNAVRPAHVAMLVRDIWSSGRHFTARRVLYETRAMFDQAILADLVERNPAAPIKMPPTSVARSRMSFEHWQKIQYWADQHGRPWFAYALRLALVTGQRRADLVGMQKLHIRDDHLHIDQQKTGARIALPLSLHLDALGVDLREVIRESDDYRRPGNYLLRKRDDSPLGPASLSDSFAMARNAALAGQDWKGKHPPTFHEIRSLSERLYRDQGIDTQTLLGHKRRSMTDEYNDDRGLSADNWKRLTL